jgi:hypothetical protein
MTSIHSVFEIRYRGVRAVMLATTLAGQEERGREDDDAG